MNLNRLHHVAIICSDYEQAKEFYVNKLQLPLVREVYRPERRDYILTLLAGEVEIELFIMEDPPLRLTNPEARGLRHLAFHVEDIDPVIHWLNGMGIETEPVRIDPFTGGRMTFFRDPDGLPLELHE
ncbi:MAG: VOC family protein [Oscillospiraceae bacterium]|nr:VOC family protein [Oscillospiraceae bacterium]